METIKSQIFWTRTFEFCFQILHYILPHRIVLKIALLCGNDARRFDLEKSAEYSLHRFSSPNRTLNQIVLLQDRRNSLYVSLLKLSYPIW